MKKNGGKNNKHNNRSQCSQNIAKRSNSLSAKRKYGCGQGGGIIFHIYTFKIAQLCINVFLWKVIQGIANYSRLNTEVPSRSFPIISLFPKVAILNSLVFIFLEIFLCLYIHT